jgi:hypothetical protein
VDALRRTPGRVRDRKAWRFRDEGQSLAEYALILAFVALAAVTALSMLGNAIADSPGFRLFQ